MLNPIIRWTNKDLIVLGDSAHPEVPNKIQFNDGTFNNPILADTDSAEVEFCVTNNFEKGKVVTDACFDMKNCSITVKKPDGSMEEQLVQEKWVRVKCVSKGDADFTAIGAHLDGASYVEDSYAIGCGDSAVGVNNISGAANDGDETKGGKNNVARMIAKCHPSLLATAGKHPFKFRLVYTYGTGV